MDLQRPLNLKPTFPTCKRRFCRPMGQHPETLPKGNINKTEALQVLAGIYLDTKSSFPCPALAKASDHSG